MDAHHFDALTRFLSAPDSRRHVLRALGLLPAAGGLLAVTTSEDAEAKRKKKKKKRKKKNRKKCTPESAAKTCAGKCGKVTNNCNQVVNCSACACVPNCTGKCDGGSDGCGGICTGTCPGGSFCDGGICTACDVCTSGCAYDSVAAAIAAAGAGATIVVCPGNYSTHVTLTQNVTLIGAGTSGNPEFSTHLNGDFNGRVLQVNAGVTATVRNLWISDGTSDGNGAGVVNQGTLTLERVAMSNHVAQGNGGAIFNEGTLTITDGVVFISEGAFGGGIYNNGAGAKTTLVRTQLNDNKATSPAPSGGGIYNNAGQLTIDDQSSFTGNMPDTCVSSNGGTGCPS